MNGALIDVYTLDLLFIGVPKEGGGGGRGGEVRRGIGRHHTLINISITRRIENYRWIRQRLLFRLA